MAAAGSIARASAERDPRSLFDLDERLIELMDRAEEAAERETIPEDLLQEINDYLEAFRNKVDRIAGYWRWQESIAGICGAEAERLSARKRAAEGRVTRLKDMLLYFMMSRALQRLEGEKASIAMQPNGMASLVDRRSLSNRRAILRDQRPLHKSRAS